jgi:hypothetical protein
MINNAPSLREVLHTWQVRLGGLLSNSDNEHHTGRIVCKAFRKGLRRDVMRQLGAPGQRVTDGDASPYCPGPSPAHLPRNRANVRSAPGEVNPEGEATRE